MPHWRAMRADDLAAAEAMGSAYHVHHPEGPDIAVERLRLAPDWCFVLEAEDGRFAGYCVSHPWGGALPPALNVLLHELPTPADSLHIHDVIVHADLRGQGLATPLVRTLLGQATAAGLGKASLVAVGNAAAFWKHQGFEPDHDPDRVAFVSRSYGAGATPLQRPLLPK